MSTKQWNWRLWAGLASSLLALPLYVVSVVILALDRNVFWLSVALFVVAAVFLVGGLQRAFRQPESYRGKVAGPIVTVLSLAVLGLFSFASYQVRKHLPAAENAPRLGQKAPDFTLPDSGGSAVSLAQLLTTPLAGGARYPKGVLVVFYRGYW
jgi:hypothetical protein